jgi:quinol-cytochrome oxidoreductase complex cytochrome b subunit
MRGGLERAARGVLGPVDRWLNRLYGSRYNPVYWSGPISVGLLVVLLITGVYLLLFYRIGAPYESVERITEQAWGGRWIRSLHRYASDAAVVSIAVHAFRMFAQHRSWGPRALAWVSGLVLLGVLFVSGWTGYVMIWDVQAQLLATEGARLLDVLPLFSEPLGRTFVGDQPLPAAFFFLNLFLHIALPVGMLLLLWLHVSKLARPVLLRSEDAEPGRCWAC